MKETLSLLLATVVILTLSVGSFKTVSAAQAVFEPKQVTEQAKKDVPENAENDSSIEETAEDATDSASQPEEIKEEVKHETVGESEKPEDNGSEAEETPVSTATPTTASSNNTSQRNNTTQQNNATRAVTNTGSNNLSAAQRLNAAPLNPRYTGYTALDNEIKRILNQVTTPGMSTYQKLKACYTYVATHTTYGRPSGKYYLPYGSDRECELAITLFYEGRGMCDCYSAAFSVLARAIGVNCYTHTGETKYSAGYWDSHDWAEAYINGVYYVFDANVEDNVNGGYGELYFCKTYSELKNSHVR